MGTGGCTRPASPPRSTATGSANTPHPLIPLAGVALGAARMCVLNPASIRSRAVQVGL